MGRGLRTVSPVLAPALALAAAVLAAAAPAGAQSSGDGYLDGDVLRVEARGVDGGGDPGDPGGGGGDGGSASPFRRVHERATLEMNGVRFGVPCDDFLPDLGWLWWSQLVERASGRVIERDLVCIRDGEAPGSGDPEPPTYQEIWDAIALPGPRIGVNPVRRGLTGLESRFWVESPTAVAVDVTIDGFTVTGEARLVRATISTEGRAATGDAGDLGSGEAPLLRHTYRKKGTRDVEVITVWEATVSIGAVAAVPIGTAELDAEAPYRVVEARAVLRP